MNTTNPDSSDRGDGRGASRREAGERTRARILDTAQELFAVKGVDGVSINEICKTCDVNSAAVHYHFGAKPALVEAILARGAATWGPRRDALIAELTADGTPDLRSAVTVMIRPTAELARIPWGLNYIRFLFTVTNHPDYGPLTDSIAEAHTNRYLDLLSGLLPHLSRATLLRRYTLTRMFLYQALSIEDGPLARWLEQHGVVDDEPLEDHLIDYFTAALGAP